MIRPLARLIDILTGGRPDSPQNRWKTESRWRRDKEEISWQLMVMMTAIIFVIVMVFVSQIWLHGLQSQLPHNRLQ